MSLKRKNEALGKEKPAYTGGSIDTDIAVSRIGENRGNLCLRLIFKICTLVQLANLRVELSSTSKVEPQKAICKKKRSNIKYA